MEFLSLLKASKFLHQVCATATATTVAERRRWRPNLEALEDRLVPATITIDAAAGVHAIDANIYGTAFATSAQLADLNIPLNRAGGNTTSTYNWQQDASNRSSDWFFESIADGSGTPGKSMDDFVNAAKAAGAQASVTIPMLDWVAKLGPNRGKLSSYSVAKYGQQQSTDYWMPDAGNGTLTNGQQITWNDPNDAYTPNSTTLQRAWVQHLISTFGNSSAGGVRYYTMDNEPGLWNSTHRDVHPGGTTMTELRDKIISYASMIKSLDPNAKILGPEEWGWTNYFISGADAAAQNWGAKYDGLAAMPWLLDQLHKNDQATGQRLLDYFTLHFYPQGGEFSDDVSQNMQLLRNQSTRSLWDPNYVDQSWIASTGINGGKVNLINLMESWVNTYYPGTKTGITEYNWGAEGHMNGATTQADILGIFGREGLDLANRWTTPATNSPTYLAMKMYRNYDGNDSTFGDTSVSASVANPDQVSAFASKRSSDGALTIMVVNKNLYSSSATSTSLTLNIGNFVGNGIAQEWQLAAINPSNQTQAGITHLSDISVSGNTFTISAPNQSVTLFVLMPGTSTPPAAPATLTAAAGSGQVTLNWASVASATSYNVYRATATGAETLYRTGVTGTSFIDTGLTNGTTYYYQVAAANSSGTSPRSIERSATPQVTAPAAPASLAAAAGNAQITLTWSASSGATSYNVYRSTTNGNTGTTPFRTGVTGTAFTDTGLTNGTTYYYQVSTVNAGGQSAKSVQASATPQVSAPAAPTNLTSVAGNAQVTVGWAAASGATSYNVYRSTASGAETLLQSGVTGTSFTNTGLANGTRYYYKVAAVNAGGTSPLSSETSAVPQVGVPGTPTGLTATAGNAQVALSWTAVTGAASYNVYRATSSGAETLLQSGVTGTTFTNTGLTNGTSYFYKVAAVNAGGTSPLSVEASATPQAPATFTGAHINFTTASGEAVAGYLADSGAAFGNRGNGLSYGWNVNNAANARDRDAAISPSELYDSFNHMQKASNPNARWEIAVPNGTYQVHIIAGDASSTDSVFKINAEGVLAVNGTPTSAKRWVENTVTVTVTDGRLTISNASGARNNKIDAIDITPAVARIALNAGGGATGAFQADGQFTGGMTSTTTAAIDTTLAGPLAAPAAVYQSERYGTFTYKLTGLTAGAGYTVRLHFAEIYWDSAGQRTFNVKINGTQVLTNFDIIAVAGGKNRAIVRDFTAVADSLGQLTLDFVSITNYAKVSGIEVR